MKITAISDLHGHYPKLNGGDLLIVAGDLTARDEVHEYLIFLHWIENQKYKKKIVIAGNHDNELCKKHVRFSSPDVEYLEDSGTEFEGLKIWGSPWTAWFKGINPKCKAFTLHGDARLAKKWAMIPDDTDILVTHSPPFAIFDSVWNGRVEPEHVGSESLNREVFQRIKPKVHIFGHIHEHGGKYRTQVSNSIAGTTFIKFINASHVNEHYEPVNEPVEIG